MVKGMYWYMEDLSASMGVCGSAGAGLGASGNVPSMNFCSESLSAAAAAAAATPCIFPDRERRNKVRQYKEEEEQQRQSCGAESCDLTSWMKLLFC